MQIFMNRNEFAEVRNIINALGNPTVTEVFNNIFSDTPPKGISWIRSKDKSMIDLSIADDLTIEAAKVLTQYAPGLGKGMTSVAAIPKLISSLKNLGEGLKKVFKK